MKVTTRLAEASLTERRDEARVLVTLPSHGWDSQKDMKKAEAVGERFQSRTAGAFDHNGYRVMEIDFVTDDEAAEYIRDLKQAFPAAKAVMER